MIDCPKCKFRQPKDQYCASCGIDMVSFKSTTPKKNKSLFANGSFVVLILICIASLIAYLISKSDRPQSWVKKISYNTKTTHFKSMNQSSSSIPTESENDQQIEVVPSPNVHLNSLAAEPDEKSTDLNSAEAFSTDIKLTFAEVQREDLAAWTNESQRLDLYQSFIDFSAGIIPNFKTRFQSKYKELKIEQKKLFLRKPQAILLGNTLDDTSEFIGFQTNLDLKSQDNQITKGHFHITKISRYGKTELPIEFELQKDAVFFMNWKTAMTGFENENLLFTTPPFQVLKSPDFLNQKTEFIILIEPL